MKTPLKIASINIEGSKHLQLVIPFLITQRPDVVCMQELIEEDIPFFEEALGMSCTFARMATLHTDEGQRALGIGIFTYLPVVNSQIEYYVDHRNVGDSTVENLEAKYAGVSYVLLLVEVEKNGVPYTFLTTHTPVTDNAQITDFQQEAFTVMLEKLSVHPSFVLCGDFNSPRGDFLFDQLASLYTDNVPQKYTTSIDPTIHRSGPLEYLVDGIFSTKDITVCNVEMHCGVSDHCALVGEILK